MFYVVQKNIFKETNYNLIFEALNKLELDYEIVEYDKQKGFDIKTDRKDVFPFGSVRLAKESSSQDWKPGSFYGGNHDFSIYSQHYGENLLNHDSKIISFGDEITWLPNEVKFIRPTKDSKFFNGKLFSKTKWEDLVENMKINPFYQVLTEQPLIQIGSPKTIYKEARIWIVDGKIVTSSYYYYYHSNVEYHENVEPEGLEFAKNMIDLYQVAECFVMDICLTPDGWKIVEINCINCAGFYKGDLQKILIALEDKYNPVV